MNVAGIQPPVPSWSVTGHWAVSLLFLRIPRTAKESLSTSYVVPSATAVAELAESLNCHCVLAAGWKVFSPVSPGSPCQALLPRDEGLGSPLDGGRGGQPWVCMLLILSWGWKGCWCWKLGKRELLCSQLLGSEAGLSKSERVSLVFETSLETIPERWMGPAKPPPSWRLALKRAPHHAVGNLLVGKPRHIPAAGVAGE